jgi:hypothetical protein
MEWTSPPLWLSSATMRPAIAKSTVSVLQITWTFRCVDFRKTVPGEARKISVDSVLHTKNAITIRVGCQLNFRACCVRASFAADVPNPLYPPRLELV